ncbi:nicotinate-nucleotide adenylyltransferase [Roseomonas sp. BN140053]|uniref:nicotinate-nucleotide adenylyltransferase n=1 Tax=Roseomonas sp. BN140053 TaxID=3391898 RepID=UPI0039E89B05
MAEPGPRGDGRQARIGLLGGSFNPAHRGHQHVAECALRALRLDAVWLLVSPGNPLKARAGMAPFRQRLLTARAIADGRRVLATEIEAALGYRRTERTLARLHQLFPRVRFVFIIGADNLWQLPRWGGWRRLARRTALAVLPRPDWTRRALHGQAAAALQHGRRRPGALLAAPPDGTPRWTLIPAREDAASATALRALHAPWGIPPIAGRRNRGAGPRIAAD